MADGHDRRPQPALPTVRKWTLTQRRGPRAAVNATDSPGWRGRVPLDHEPGRAAGNAATPAFPLPVGAGSPPPSPRSRRKEVAAWAIAWQTPAGIPASKASRRYSQPRRAIPDHESDPQSQRGSIPRLPDRPHEGSGPETFAADR